MNEFQRSKFRSNGMLLYDMLKHSGIQAYRGWMRSNMWLQLISEQGVEC